MNPVLKSGICGAGGAMMGGTWVRIQDTPLNKRYTLDGITTAAACSLVNLPAGFILGIAAVPVLAAAACTVTGSFTYDMFKNRKNKDNK